MNSKVRRLHANHCITEITGYLVCILPADATVKLDPWVDASIVTHLSQLAYLLHLVLNELLATKAGVHCTVQNTCYTIRTVRLHTAGGWMRLEGQSWVHCPVHNTDHAMCTP